MIHDSKIIEIFCEIDDFCNAFENYLATHDVPNYVKPLKNQPGPRRSLCASEVLTILILYHKSGMKCFKYYYEEIVKKGGLHSYFPKAVSYTHFLELITQSKDILHLFLVYKCGQSQHTNHYYIDSKKLPICHNKRIKQNKVFCGLAQSGKSSMGWFYGFKIHLVINHLGEIVSFAFTTGNVSDNNKTLLVSLLDGLKGKCYGDKGYLTKLFEQFFEQGLHIIYKTRKNMKNKLMPLLDKIHLKKRGVIESVNALLIFSCDIEHTRHRKPENAFAHMYSALIAYCYLDKKPSITNKEDYRIAA